MRTENSFTPSNPLLVFILGKPFWLTLQILTYPLLSAPCSGKSTLCATLATRYNLDHISIGNEMRELVSPTPTGPTALIKPTSSATKIATYKQNVMANTLALTNLTPKYVKEHLFGVGAQPGVMRFLVDGFPRDAARWPYSKDIVRDLWVPSERVVVVVLNINREIARERYEKRSRIGDAFDERFDDHEDKIRPIVDAIREDGVTMWSYRRRRVMIQTKLSRGLRVCRLGLGLEEKRVDIKSDIMPEM
jgi:UMP-CMP kinase